MLWEVELRPKGPDGERQRVCEEYDLLTHAGRGGTLATPQGVVELQPGAELITGSARGYFLQGDLNREQVERLVSQLLGDSIVETIQISKANDAGEIEQASLATVLLKPGVMDPTALSVETAASDLGIPLQMVHTFRRYYANGSKPGRWEVLLNKVFCNDAIEMVVEGPIKSAHLKLGLPYTFHLVIVPLRELDDAALKELSRSGQLALNLAEMRAIQAHFREVGRDPTDVELESLAQTWSEHCSHKTLKGPIDFDGRRINNLLKETIFGATQEIRRRLGPDDWCVSVFEDNAGVVRFTDAFHVCFKVETHNHPSAIEPYGGSNTGLGGVIRDLLGTGLAAQPIANTDVFCFAPPDTTPESLPPGVLHPLKVMKGVVSGVRDYGNRMGIPTVNGAVYFDRRYLANPLVYCGTVGLLPVDRSHKEVQAGDLVVVLGGRTGRDGIHGATFSSLELVAESEQVSGGAVQIGNAITEKKLLDVLLQARDAGLYRAVTDCGAGGLSSAVGEMAAPLGAVVDLEKAPLKYAGLSYTEIWISESQERMVLAVPAHHWPELQRLCAAEDVEAVAIGTFEATGRLRLLYEGQQVADLDMHFLHDGRPEVVRKATLVETRRQGDKETRRQGDDYTADLLQLVSSLNVCSKEWVIRQYDHEVQGGSVVKPLVGVRDDGPGDAAVLLPLASVRAAKSAEEASVGLAIGCGMCPGYGDLDPYAMALAAIDEAVRNVVAVGADPRRVALLDNFCWGNCDRPEVLGSLVRAAEACRDAALALGTPFISGKDSLNNEYHSGDTHLVIPPTLLISALGRVPDVRRCVTMDLKAPGNALYLIGTTRDELGGSQYSALKGWEDGTAPVTDLALAPRIFAALHNAIQAGLVRSCHDLSDGGLAVAAAEMAFAGEVGADLKNVPTLPDEAILFAESTTRFLVEVTPASAAAFEALFKELPSVRVGETCKEPRLRIAGSSGEWIMWASLADLKEAWQKPLRW